jgi:hypothetical protein
MNLPQMIRRVEAVRRRKHPVYGPWPKPTFLEVRSWVEGELVTPGHLNAYMRQNYEALGLPANPE